MSKFLKYLISYLVFPFSFLFPRKKERMSFGCAKGRFEGNSKYLFLEYSSNGLDVCWISPDRGCVRKLREMGLKAEYVFSLRGALRALTSGWWIVASYSSDILWCLSGGARIFNLWHGVGLKRCEFNIESGPLAERYCRKTLKERFYHPEVFRRPDLFLSASPFQTAMFAPAFRIGPQQCIEKGYPRNRILYCSEEERQAFLGRYEHDILPLIERMRTCKEVYVYMPTWREDGSSALSGLDYRALESSLAKSGSLLVIKDHFNNGQEGNRELDHIVCLDPLQDIYPLLPYASCLITDYSSVLYDFLLMEGKKVLLYLFDIEKYRGQRDFFYPFEENVAGQKVFTAEELLKAIEEGVPELTQEERQRLIHKFWGENAKDYDFSDYLHIQ